MKFIKGTLLYSLFISGLFILFIIMMDRINLGEYGFYFTCIFLLCSIRYNMIVRKKEEGK